MRSLILAFLTAVLAAAGCGGKGAQDSKPVKATSTGKQAKLSPSQRPAKSGEKPVKPLEQPIAAPPQKELEPKTAPRTERTEGTLKDLVNQAAANEFRLPEINEAKVAAAGIRKLSGKHLTIYTDLAADPAVEELPKVFDLALPQWTKYFDLDEKTAADWKVVGYLMKDKDKFAGVGLLPDNLPPFLHGYQRGSEFWWYD
ncbi:MAG: hypothetical protein K8R36_25190, partial [Planctomycetales bacterium]|nr:hypothetical protein [Planctomycetales bacterium]